MTEETFDLTVMGTGYVGLVSGAAFAEIGHRVVCINIDAERIEALTSCRIPIYEPGLEELVSRNLARGNLSFSVNAAEAIAQSHAVIIAVGTPSLENGSADLSYVFRCAETIAENIRPSGIVITKSTVPVGTGDQIEQIISSRRPGAAIAVVSNPEFLKEGSAIDDFLNPDRIVTGSDDDFSPRFLRTLYAPLLLDGANLIQTSRRSAELIKYAANAFLATKITFINEMADLCEKTGADIGQVAKGMGLDKRIGDLFLNAGPAYGGSCFPKDTSALLRSAQENGVHLGLVEQTILSNEARKYGYARKVASLLGNNVRDKRIAVLGLTFKAGTDDVRDSPAMVLINALQALGAHISACDPKGEAAARKILRNVEYSDNPYDCARNADALVLMTDWQAFKNISFDQLAKVMKRRIVFDLRRIWDPAVAARHGFTFETIGRDCSHFPAAIHPLEVVRMNSIATVPAIVVQNNRKRRKEKNHVEPVSNTIR